MITFILQIVLMLANDKVVPMLANDNMSTMYMMTKS
jgi:hypothetical protein